ncbi:MAG: hypothetical protein ACOCQR_03905 [bacterium]
MKTVDGKLFNSVDEEFDRDVVVTEVVGEKSIKWNNFKAEDVVISCKKNCKEVAISLDGGVIDGNLTINGLKQELNKIKIVNVQAKKISIYNVQAKKIEITGNIGNIEIINSDANDYHICGEIKNSIFLLRSGSRTSLFEINGCANSLKLKNVIANKFKIVSFEYNQIRGEDINIQELYLPTDWSINLNRIDVKNLYLFKDNKATGTIHNLRNAVLEF